MRIFILTSVVAFLTALALGCGEGPVFHEDVGALTGSSDSSETAEKPDQREVQEDERMYDPEFRRQAEEQQQQQQEEEQQEEQREESIQNASDALTKIGEHINNMAFDEAKKLFDEHKDSIEQAADEGMMDSDQRIADLYKDYWEKIKKMREILDQEDLEPEKKKDLAMDAYSAAGDSKRAAGQLKIYER